MSTISKAIGAAAGGLGVAGLGEMTVLPPGTPWWGHLLAFAISAAVPAITTYLAPKNAPATPASR